MYFIHNILIPLWLTVYFLVIMDVLVTVIHIFILVIRASS